MLVNSLCCNHASTYRKLLGNVLLDGRLTFVLLGRMDKILCGSTQSFVVILPVLDHRFEANTKQIGYLLPGADQISDISNHVGFRAPMFCLGQNFGLLA